MRPTASSPRKKTVRVAALVASAAMVVIGVQSGQASAQPERSREAGATALPLTAPERATAIKAAQADASAQAESLGLGAKEKLVVRTSSRTPTAPSTPATSAPTTGCPSSAAT